MLCRKGQGAGFGWSKRFQREESLEAQLAVLRAAAHEMPFAGSLIASQGEHEVYYEDHDAHVFKATNSRQFGFVVDQENDNRGNKLCLREALPSEYLLRLGTQNAVFGDKITVQGILKGGVPSIVTAQPFAENNPPSEPEIIQFLSDMGFVRVPEEMMMSQFFSQPFWYRASDSVLLGDAKPGNFVRISDTIIVPIDVISHPYPKKLILRSAAQNGVSPKRLGFE